HLRRSVASGDRLARRDTRGQDSEDDDAGNNATGRNGHDVRSQSLLEPVAATIRLSSVRVQYVGSQRTPSPALGRPASRQRSDAMLAAVNPATSTAPPQPLIDPSQATCSTGTGGAICRWVYDATGSQTAADVTLWLVEKPLKIALILVLAWFLVRL